MAGGETYKEFDTASVITSSDKDTVSLGRFAIRKREFLLGVIAITALVAVLALAIVLAVKASDSSSNSNVDGAVTSRQTGQNAGHNYCDTPACLQAAYYQKPILNEQIEPCQNFYQFACGHYKEHHEQTPISNVVTVLREITNVNRDRLAYLTMYPVQHNQPNSYEKKYQEFLASCDNHFDKMELRGIPFIKKVIEPMGGWWVFDDSVLDSFDLQDMLEKTHIKFMTDALFNIFVRTNMHNWNSKIVELEFGGLGLFYLYYDTNVQFQTVQDNYKRYMQMLATMLSFDKGIKPDTNKINTFSDDAFEVEQKIAKILISSSALRDRHHPDNLLSLSEINTHLNESVDIVRYMKTLFNEHPGKFTADTKISVARLGYFDKLGDLINSYLSSDDGKRKLHNYFIWLLIHNYAADLSWEYVHATRKLNHLIYGYKDDSSGFSRCFTKSLNSFSDVVNSLFARHFVKQEGKKEAENILEELKSVMMDGLKKLKWMSSANRNYAVNKIRDSLYKIGFPAQFTDDDYLNNQYALVDIKVDDYFGNVISLNKWRRHLYNKAVGQPKSRTTWAYHIFEPIVEYYNPWKELIVTSAFLQNPLFSYNGPKYYNYGGVGSIIATNLIHAIDEIGANYKDDGSHFGSWWSNTTLNHYSDLRKCAVDAQQNVTLGPFVDASGNLNPYSSKLFASVWAPQLLADSSGARIAFKTYQKKQTRDGHEKLPPGFSKYTNDQMFFISYAQAFCQNTPDMVKRDQLLKGRLPPSNNRVNMALNQVPEFHKAFNCPSQPSTPKKYCLLFNL